MDSGTEIGITLENAPLLQNAPPPKKSGVRITWSTQHSPAMRKGFLAFNESAEPIWISRGVELFDGLRQLRFRKKNGTEVPQNARIDFVQRF